MQPQTTSPYIVKYRSGVECDNCRKKAHRLYVFSKSPYIEPYDRLCKSCIKKTQSLLGKPNNLDERLVNNSKKINPEVLDIPDVVYSYIRDVKRLVLANIQYGKGAYRDSLMQHLKDGQEGLASAGSLLVYLLNATHGELPSLLQSDTVDMVKYAPSKNFMLNAGYGVVYIDSKSYNGVFYYEFMKALLDELKIIQRQLMSDSPAGLQLVCPHCKGFLKQESVIRNNGTSNYADYACLSHACPKNGKWLRHRVFTMDKIKYFN